MLDFLAKATLQDVAEHQPSGRTGGPRKQRNPEGLAIRLFRDGSVYPSADLVAKFSLEYPNAVLKEKVPIPMKEGETEQKYSNRFEVEDAKGNGFDVIDTATYPSFNAGGGRFILVSPVDRDKGRVDLFASTGYNEDGTPKSSVMNQGAKTFGADELIPMLKEVYGDVMPWQKAGVAEEEAVDFIDLALVSHPVTGEPWKLPEGKQVTYIPKKVSRGKDAGAITTIRRENPEFYALVPVSLIEKESNSGTELADNQPTTDNVEQPTDNPFVAQQ